LVTNFLGCLKTKSADGLVVDHFVASKMEQQAPLFNWLNGWVANYADIHCG
jgi:hypothetical protein